ncbi:MAG TPA: diguanylate cyclase [Solirubrobacterales bacterium]|nr:diguanylate cyclase [Solirubrobacterales bacterium]
MLGESRVADEAFRIGGDEFAILMPETSHGDALVAAERLAERIGAAGLGDGGIGASFGIAAVSDRDSAALLAAADRELLAAKDRLYGRS